MTCYHPLKGYIKNNNGKRSFTFKQSEGNGNLAEVACGQCIGCRISRTKSWAIRCANEIQLHEESCFLTLTYNPENLPKTGSLNKKHLSAFMKALRKTMPFDGNSDDPTQKKIRFYGCGEYGDQLQRPHYHLILFGHDFPDKQFYREIKGSVLYTSPTLQKIWGKGFCSIGTANFQTAAYVSRYIMKKQLGDNAEKHYQSVDTITGELIDLEPEFTQMSNRPGIGADWLKQYISDVFPSDEIVHGGKTYQVPQYYLDLLKKINPKMHEQIRLQRLDYIDKSNPEDKTYERLAVRKICAQSKLNQQQRHNEV